MTPRRCCRRCSTWRTPPRQTTCRAFGLGSPRGAPFDATRRTLWGLPITTTNAQTAGVAHTLASDAVGLNTDSQGVQIAWSENSNADDWSKNLIRARCEGRYATSVFQPLGVVQSDLTA